MAATRCIKASRCGEDDLLKFKPSIRMGKKRDLSDFELGMVFGDRRAGLSVSKTADLLGFSYTTISCLIDVRGQRRMGRLVKDYRRYAVQPRYAE